MKLITVIFAFYIFALNLVPTLDMLFDKQSNDSCLISCCEQQQSNQSSDSEEGCPDLCNPFMSCSTCIGFIFQSFTIEFEAFDLTNRTVTDYYESFAKRYRSSIWHPPKLA